ncbi:hypothetical protein HUT16_11995 [Kitasatospora sp. NA04385]|uniref:hypothetical protein n=1 Tax=Kitasatospora sp. NA04385 TaxID=2742135 RepID=UPI0015908D4B|nr:hypothetical protein [Kitasatospora sp. NA04385]QKW19685.1 hypothetical protein HUT16_11995 [Kitasatospora sp. NA04385]
MASVRRTAAVRTAAVLLAAAALLGAPAARAADASPTPAASPTASATTSPTPSPSPSDRQLARTGGGDATADGVLLSLGSVLLLTGAAFVVLCRRRPGNDR